jgi:hypothetical protein
VRGLIVASLAERVRKPFKTFIQTVSGGGAGGLDVLHYFVSGVGSAYDGVISYPGTLSETVKTKLVGDFCSVHSILCASRQSQHFLSEFSIASYRQILLVGEDQEESVPQLILVQHALKFLTCLYNTIAIVGVDHEDNTLGVLEVMPPERSDLVLTPDVPYGELNVLVLNGLDVEACSPTYQQNGVVEIGGSGLRTNGGDRSHDFTELELIQNRGLSGGVQTNHQNSHLLLSP